MLPYVSCYFLVGLLLGLSAALHRTFARKKRAAGILFTVFCWPLFVLAAPDAFFQSRNEDSRPREELKASLAALSLEDELALSAAERLAVREIALVGDQDTTYVGAWDSTSALQAYFSDDIPPAAYYALRNARQALVPKPDSPILLFSRTGPEWYVGFSRPFLKSIAGIDGKQQGRLLRAISFISESPVSLHGDTIKPLTSKLSGLWRYRLGDSRLVYFPNQASKKVTLLFFGPRASVYVDIPDPKPFISGS